MSNVDHAVPDGEAPVVVEWAPFQLAAGVTETALLTASESLQRDFLARQPGFLRRELIRLSADQWVDLVYWQNEASAKSVMDAVGSSPVCHSYFRLMVGADTMDAGAGVLHGRRVRVYE